jgi:hypothetical protein
MNAISTELKSFLPVNPDNPAELGYPVTLPIEVALRTAPIKTICEAYGLSREEWEVLRNHPQFVKDVAVAHDELKKEGMSFRMKARLQSEELLKTSWRLIHASNDDVPPSVKADLIKFTIRAAGLEADKGATGGPANNLQININLG